MSVQLMVPVCIYKVTNQHGDELAFTANVDHDGDICIELDVPDTATDTDGVLEYVSEPDQLHDVLTHACKSGLVKSACAILEFMKEEKHALYTDVLEGSNLIEGNTSIDPDLISTDDIVENLQGIGDLDLFDKSFAMLTYLKDYRNVVYQQIIKATS